MKQTRNKNAIPLTVYEPLTAGRHRVVSRAVSDHPRRGVEHAATAAWRPLVESKCDEPHNMDDGEQTVPHASVWRRAVGSGRLKHLCLKEHFHFKRTTF